MKGITAHVMVKNEDCYIWYAIMSTIDFVDKMIIFDTGSQDDTKKIIEYVINLKDEYKNKIIYQETPVNNRNDFTVWRQKQLDMTETEFFFTVDGDEIWWEDSLKEIRDIIEKDDDVKLIATRDYYCAGDIFHYRDKKRDKYGIKGVWNNTEQPPVFLEEAANIRIYSKNIPGLHIGGPYGIEGAFDENNKDVQNNVYKTVVQNGYYLHASYLQRSSMKLKDVKVYSRLRKMFTSYDYTFPKDFHFPEIMYKDKPDFIFDPFKYKMGFERKIINTLRRIGRK